MLKKTKGANHMTIKTIVFDLDDTLLWDEKSIATAFERTCHEAAIEKRIDATLFEQKVRAAARALYESYPVFDYTQQIGINPFEGLWGGFDDPTPEFQQLRAIAPDYRQSAWYEGLLSFAVDDKEYALKLSERFVEVRRESPFLYPETLSVLEKLQKNYQLVMLTNGAPSLQNEKLAITPELKGYFDRIIISGDFGYGKPDKRLFEYLLLETGANIAETLMVGDNLKTDILGASRIGMASAWINREDKIPNLEVTPTYEIKNLSELEHLLHST